MIVFVVVVVVVVASLLVTVYCLDEVRSRRVVCVCVCVCGEFKLSVLRQDMRC